MGQQGKDNREMGGLVNCYQKGLVIIKARFWLLNRARASEIKILDSSGENHTRVDVVLFSELLTQVVLASPLIFDIQ